MIPLSRRIVTPLTHTANEYRERLPRSTMRIGDDWLQRQQHQHHPAACFMLAAGAALASNWPASGCNTAAILPLFHQSLTQRQRGCSGSMPRSSSSPLRAAASRASHFGTCHASEISRNPPRMDHTKAVMRSSPPSRGSCSPLLIETNHNAFPANHHGDSTFHCLPHISPTLGCKRQTW